ncbi:hypothetical protein BCR44DRAFT_231298 [Catenaria anguillulae PL171]|uniref:Uncharacterized protein n=1 Tax=Catenaria anguillulae PL171 TaxID=765915 RepID=A0A1Y2HF57_9FUNG|nr:hypothetical protein BCR44DRAFT_231298 [Catenaria anguillulae PL171]
MLLLLLTAPFFPCSRRSRVFHSRVQFTDDHWRWDRDRDREQSSSIKDTGTKGSNQRRVSAQQPCISSTIQVRSFWFWWMSMTVRAVWSLLWMLHAHGNVSPAAILKRRVLCSWAFHSHIVWIPFSLLEYSLSRRASSCVQCVV